MTTGNLALKMYLVENAVNGEFSKGYREIANAMDYNNSASANYRVKELVEEGFLTIKSSGRKGRGSTSILSVPNVVQVDFCGEKLMIKHTEIGWAMRSSDVAKATLEHEEILEKIISSNKIQFEPNVIKIEGETYLNKVAVILYMNKLNLDNVLELKVNTLNQFQLQCVDLLSSAILTAKVELTPSQHIEITSNLSKLTDVSIEEVRKLLSDVEGKVNNLMSIQKDELTRYKDKFETAKRESNLYQSKLKGYESQVVELRQKVLDLQH